MAQGTNNRPRRQLEVEIENMGGHLNAYTSREQTVYYAKVFKSDVPKAMDILSDILTGSKLDDSSVEVERGIILREMEEVEKQPEEVIFDKLHETAYQGSGLGRTILGPRENIMSITRDDLQQYIKTHYTAPRVVIASAGAVDHAQLTELADKHFGHLPGRNNPSEGALVEAPLEPCPFVGSDIRMRDDAMPSAHVAVAFETGGWTDAHSFPLMVMQQMLGQWDRSNPSGANMASPMCRSLAEGGHAHSAMTFNTTYKDTGLFGVYFVTPPTEAFMASYHVMFELARLTAEVSQEELERAKQQVKTSLLMQLDGSTAVCEDIGRQVLTYNRRMTPAEIFARIDAVSLDSVKKAASAVIFDHDPAIAAIGHIHELPDYNWFRRRTYRVSA